jgi:hypothetical protein
MTFTYSGYSGTIDETEYALRAKYEGSTYMVGGQNDFKPTINTGADRTVSFAVGQAWGHNVLVKSDAVVTKQTTSVGSGSRWDTFVLRRNWSTNSATVEVVTGSSVKAVAGGVTSNPGSSSDDQLLCLARVTAGQALIQEIWDLRTWQGRVTLAIDLAAIKNPYVGQIANIGGTKFTYRADPTNSLAWIPDDTLVKLADSSAVVPASGWSIVSQTQRCLTALNGQLVQYDIAVRRTGAALQFSSTTGNIGDNTICTVSGPIPDIAIPVQINSHMASSPTGALVTVACQGYMSAATGGSVRIGSGPPGMYILPELAGTTATCHILFMKEF